MQINTERILRLPLRLRLAWGAFSVKSVVEQYPKTFLNKYLQHNCIELAWKYSQGMDVSHNDITQLISRIREVSDEADVDGYSLNELLMGVDLVDEIMTSDRKSIYASIECAASAYSFMLLRKMNLKDSEVSTKYFDSIQAPFWRLAEETLVLAESRRSKPPTKHMFDSYVL